MTPDGTSPGPRTYIRDGVGLICLGVGGWGAAPIAGYPGWAIPALLIGVALGTLTLVLGYRSARREDLLIHLADVLAPLIGAAAGRARGLIDATRWTMGAPGQPRRIRIHYSHGRIKLPEATVELGDQRWANEIARQVGTRLAGAYLVADNNAVKGKLTLRLTDPAGDGTVPETKQVVRAKKIVNELLAGTATFNKLQVDETTGEVTRIEVKHDVGTKLVASGYRNRVERTVSAMLQDRWRAKWDLEADKVIFEVRPTLPASVWIPPLDPPDDDPLANYREVRIPFGVDEDGEVIAWRPAVSPQWLVTGGTGSGKRLALSTPIPTPSGWTTMGDLAEGDLVLARDGRPCRVEKLWAVEAQPDLYRITFSDGQTVLADAEHQWLVSTRSARRAVKRPGRRSAVERHRRASARIELLDQLALTCADKDVTLRELLDYLTENVPDLTWATQLSLRAALEAVDCPFLVDDRSVPRRGSANFTRPVRIYRLPVAVKALAVRLAEQHHTPPATDVDEVRMTTGEMLAAGVRLGAGGHANFAVRITSPLQLPTADLPLDPYVLGAWLGDGTSSSGGFTGIDQEILNEIREAGFEVHSHERIAQAHYIRGLMPALRSLGVLNNKHIPERYLRSAEDQRLALLQGLMDTDGTVDVGGACELGLSDRRLAEDALDLIRSLGIKASMSTAAASYRDSAGQAVACRDRHRIHFTTNVPVFRLERKVLRLAEDLRGTHDWLYITSIEKAPAEPARCITVDSPDRTYLCGCGYVPTSNTSTGHGILTQISRYGWPIWIADGKGTEFLGFQDWPNVQIVASSIAEQVAVIHRAWQLMEHRYQLVVQRRARVEDFEPLMVFVDEFTDLKANLLTWYTQIKVKGDPTKPVTLSEIGSIARKGRTARVHLVLTLQRPDAEILTGEVRENFGQRTSLGPISPQGAEMMWNNPVTGVALPRGRTGRAIGTNNAGIPVEMQAYRVPDPKDVIPGTDEYELIEKLRPAESRHERLLIVPPEINWDGEEPVEPTFTDYLEADWVKAVDRRDLDPLAGLEGVAGEVVDGRALSSPMALFGLTDAGTPPANWKPTPAGGGMSPAPGEDVDSDEGLVDDLEGYAPATHLRVTGLQVGDLVCVDEDLGTWAVVEEEPIPDFDDDDCLVIAWRDDQDNSGQLVMPSESLIETRRPLGFNDLAA